MRRTTFLLVLIGILICGASSARAAWQGFNPPSIWGDAPVTALAGSFGGPTCSTNLMVVYKNMTTNACHPVPLPADQSCQLSKNVTVYGAGGADNISIAAGGSVSCPDLGVTFTVSNDTQFLNGHWLDGDGRGGDDHIAAQVMLGQSGSNISYLWGQSGDDVILYGDESAVILGGSGKDLVRGSNTLFSGSDRFLLGDDGNDDCIESNNGASTEFKVFMNGGQGSGDVFSTLGDQGTQDHQAFEGNIGANHCFRRAGETCSTGTQCFSGVCSSGTCTANFGSF